MAAEDDCHRYAAECLALAQRTTDANDKARLLDMAEAWRALALKREAVITKNSGR
jgi:hypothetical protein